MIQNFCLPLSRENSVKFSKKKFCSPLCSKLHGHHYEMMNAFLFLTMIKSLFKRCNIYVAEKKSSLQKNNMFFFDSSFFRQKQKKEKQNAALSASFRYKIVFSHWNDTSSSITRFVKLFAIRNNELNFNRNVSMTGTPKYDGNFNAIVEQARYEANIYKKHKVVSEFHSYRMTNNQIVPIRLIYQQQKTRMQFWLKTCMTYHTYRMRILDRK